MRYAVVIVSFALLLAGLLPLAVAAEPVPANWRELSGSDLVDWLVENRFDRTIEQQHREMVEHASAQYLKSLDAAKPLTRDQMLRLSSMARVSFTAERKAEVTEMLKRRFLEDIAAAEQDVTVEELVTLRAVSDQMSAAPTLASEAAVAWARQGARWNSATPRDLARLATLFDAKRSSDDAQAQAETLKHLWERGLGNQQYLADADPSELVYVVQTTVPYLQKDDWPRVREILTGRFLDKDAVVAQLTPQERASLWWLLRNSGAEPQRLRDYLVGRYLQNEPALKSLSSGELASILVALRELGTPEKPLANPTLTWMKSDDQRWRAAQPHELIQFAKSLESAEESPDALRLRQQAARLVWTPTLADEHGKFFTDPNVPGMLQHVRNWAPSLEQDQRREIAAKLRVRFTPDNEEFKGLSLLVALTLADTLKELGVTGQEHADLIAAWVVGSQAWKSSPSGEFFLLFDHLDKHSSETITKARFLLVLHAWGSCLGSGEYASGERGTQLADAALTWGCRWARDFSPEQKAELCRSLEADSASKDYLASLSGSNVAAFLAALSTAGMDGEGQSKVVLRWLEANADWRSYPPDKIVGLLQVSNSLPAEHREKFKTEVTEHAFTRFLIDKDNLAQLHKGQLDALLRQLRDSLSVGQRRQVCQVMQDVYAKQPGWINDMSAEEAAKFFPLMLGYEGKDHTPGWAYAWLMADGGRRTSLPATQLSPVLAGIFDGDHAKHEQYLTLLNQVSVNWAERHDRGELARENYRSILSWLWAAGEKEVGQRWALRYYKFATAPEQTKDVTIYELSDLSNCLHQAELVGPKHGYPEYARLLADAMVRGLDYPEDPYWPFYTLSLAVGTEEDREVVRDTLTDQEGRLRFNTMKLLAWTYFDRKTIAEWQAILDAKLQQQQLTGDRRAEWLLARAYASELEKAEYGALLGTPYANQALAAVESESMKLKCVSYLFERLSYTQRFDEAESMLASVAAEFKSDASVELLGKMKGQLTQRRQHHIDQAAALRLQGERPLLEARIAALEYQLAEARKQKGTAAKIASLEAILAGMRAALDRYR